MRRFSWNNPLTQLRWQSMRSLGQVFAPVPVDKNRQVERLRFVERDIGLVVRLVVLGVLFYYLFRSDWFEGLNVIGLVALDTVRLFFKVYVGVNLVAAGVYLSMDYLPFPLVRGVGFVINLIDGLFIGVVTLVTGGLESLAYWVFLGLMARNALTFPVASLQITLNVLLIGSYLFAGFMDRSFTRFEMSTVESLAQLAANDPEIALWRDPPPARATNTLLALSNTFVRFTGVQAQLAESRDWYEETVVGVPGDTNASADFFPAFARYSRHYARFTNAFVHFTNAYARYTNNPLGPDLKARFLPQVVSQIEEAASKFLAVRNRYEAARNHYPTLARKLPVAFRARSQVGNEFVPPALRSTYGVAEAESSTQTLLLRIFLMLLMTACAYGVQVLLDRQFRALDETREFQARESQLQAAGRVAAQVAHRVKNPLAIINSAAFCLQRLNPGAPEPLAQQVRIIREEVEKADQIITKLMGYSQLAEGRVEKLHLAKEVDQALAQVFPAGGHSEIRIEKRIPADLPPLLMKRIHLSEILVNLFLNAREAIAGPGRIGIVAELKADDAVEIRVSDAGPGIPPDRFEKVFEPYFSTKRKGTGLGLAIVKQNTEMYAGTVRIESVLGKGATFVLHFPTRTFMTEET